MLLARSPLPGNLTDVCHLVMDTVEAAAAVAVYGDRPEDPGIAAALLPAVGSAVERMYVRGPTVGALSLLLPITAACLTRRAKGGTVSVADVLTYPAAAMALGAALRGREQWAKFGLIRKERVRRRAACAGSRFFGRMQHAADGGREALDLLVNELRELTAVVHPDKVRQELLAAEDRRQDLSSRGPTASSLAERGPLPAQLSVVLRQYEMQRGEEPDIRRRVFLVGDSPAHEPGTRLGGLLLDEHQVQDLVAVLDRHDVTGDTTVRVENVQRQGSGHAVGLLIATGGAEADDGRRFTVTLAPRRRPWRLDLVTAGLLAEVGWSASIASPAHAHVPFRAMAPGLSALAAGAAIAGVRQRYRPLRHSSDLCLLVWPGSVWLAVAGGRTMRRETYVPGGTSFFPGLHVLCGNMYLLGSQYREMSRAGRACVIAGTAVQMGATWCAGSRRPGDRSGFAAELVWSTLAAVGGALLGSALRKLSSRVVSEQQKITETAVNDAWRGGWDDAHAHAEFLHSFAHGLLRQAEEAPVPDVHDDLEIHRLRLAELRSMHEQAAAVLRGARSRRRTPAGRDRASDPVGPAPSTPELTARKGTP
ncbi:hypothetical protein [Streptomyces sp. NPDC003522]